MTTRPLLTSLAASTCLFACSIAGPSPTDDDTASGDVADEPASDGGSPGTGGLGGSGAAPTTPAGGGAGGAESSSDGGMGGSPPADPTLDPEEAAFLQLINAYRGQNGRAPLSACRSLGDAAQAHSEDMRDNDYFSHTGLNMSTPLERACEAGYSHACGPTTAMAENIAAGNSGAQATFNQWMSSPGHNANMLGSGFTQIGIGRAEGGGTYGVYWTNVFGGSDEPSCE